MPLNPETIGNILVFMERVSLTGKEAVVWCAVNFQLQQEKARLEAQPAPKPSRKKTDEPT